MRKPNLTIFIPVVLLFLGCQGQNGSSGETEETNLKPAEKTAENSSQWETFERNGLIGFRDQNDFEMISPQFYKAEEFYDGVAIVANDTGYFLINFLGEKISSYYYEITADEWSMEEHVHYFAFKSPKPFVIEPPEELSIETLERDIFDKPFETDPESEFEEYEYDPLAELQDSVCILNKEGKEISIYYNEIQKVSDRSFYIATNKTAQQFNSKSSAVLNSVGAQISAWYGNIVPTGNFFVVRNKNYDEALMNDEGKLVSTYYYDIRETHNPEVFAVKKDFATTNSVGLMDTAGKILVPLKYKEIEWVPEHSFYLTTRLSGSQNLNGIISRNYAELYAPVQYIKLFEEKNLIAISSGMNYAFYEFANDSFVKISEDYQLTKISTSGTRRFFIFSVKTSSTHVYFTQFQEGLACVKQKDKYGFINADMFVVIPPIYDDCETGFVDGKCQVSLDGETFFIDKKGNRLTDN